MSLQAIRGTTKLYRFDSAPASPTAITAAEVGAAVDYTGVSGGEAAQTLAGLDAQVQNIRVPNLVSLIDTQVGGPTNLGDPSITYTWDDTTNAIFDDVTVGDLFKLVVFDYGTGVGNDYTYYDVEATGRNRDYSGDVPRWILSLAQKASPQFGTQVA